MAASASARVAPAARAQNRTLSATVRSSYRALPWPSRPTAGARPGAAGVGEVVAEYLGLARRRPAGARRRPAAATSCRPRWGREEHDLAGSTVRSAPARAGNRPSRATAARRATTGSMGPARLPGTGAGGSGWLRCRVSERSETAAAAGPIVLGGVGRTMITAGGPHPAVRRLPAVGHRHPHGAGPGPARGRPRGAARGGRGEHGERRRPSTSTTSTRRPHGHHHEPAAAGDGPALPAELIPRRGRGRRQIVIPAIGVDWVFVEGVSVADLKDGPGHYPETPMPGQAGNAAIAGHRTTYGAPFGRPRRAPARRRDQSSPRSRAPSPTRSARRSSCAAQVEVLGADYWDFDGDPATSTTRSPSPPATRSTRPASGSSWRRARRRAGPAQPRRATTPRRGPRGRPPEAFEATCPASGPAPGRRSCGPGVRRHLAGGMGGRPPAAGRSGRPTSSASSRSWSPSSSSSRTSPASSRRTTAWSACGHLASWSWRAWPCS